MIVAPSFLTADFSNLKAEIQSIHQAKWIHFDVMDGKFVENTTYDHTIVRQVKEYSNQFFDCHLMVVDPEKQINDFIEAGADLITFHLEATKQNPIDLIRAIKGKNVKTGISIKPDTKVEDLVPLLSELDLVLIMSVEPGKGGQKFMPSSLEKIAFLDEYRKKHHLSYLIEVDGGINQQTSQLVKKAGVDVVVVGSYIFNQQNRNDLILELENV